MNLSTKQKQTDIENKHMITKREKGRGNKLGVWNQQIQTTIHEINNKDLLYMYSTGDYIQYLIINYNRKESEKQYVCITESLCCTPATNTTL